MKRSLIRRAVAAVTGCDKQFRSPISLAVDRYMKPLVLVVGMYKLHGYKDEDIMDEFAIETDAKFKTLVRVFNGIVKNGSRGRGGEDTKRSFRQIILIHRYIENHNREWVKVEDFLKV